MFTIGHSTHPVGEFIAMLQSFGIETLADIRTVPRSRHNPQFEQDSLRRSLKDAGIAYTHMKALGGLRRARPDSPNTGFRNGGFRGYADYMATDEFRDALDALIALGRESKAAIMCAEAVPWRCHRNLVADALTVHGVEVRHIMGIGKANAHTLTRFAKVDGTEITYPPEDGQGRLL